VRNPLRVTLLLLGGLLVLVGLALFLLYRASQQVPEFYREAVAVDPQAQKKAAGKMVERAAELNNSLQTKGRWEAAFTAEEINGWLAVELPRAEPPVLPPQLHDPRVAIAPDGVTVAAQAEYGGISTVVSLKLDVYLQSPNVLAVRVRDLRAGAVPWRRDQVVQNVGRAAEHAGLAVRWQQIDGDPVALVTLPPQVDHGRTAHVDAIKLEKDRLVVTGTTERKGP